MFEIVLKIRHRLQFIFIARFYILPSNRAEWAIFGIYLQRRDPSFGLASWTPTWSAWKTSWVRNKSEYICAQIFLIFFFLNSGKDWENHVKGQKPKADGDSFRLKRKKFSKIGLEKCRNATWAFRSVSIRNARGSAVEGTRPDSCKFSSRDHHVGQGSAQLKNSQLPRFTCLRQQGPSSQPTLPFCSITYWEHPHVRAHTRKGTVVFTSRSFFLFLR